MATTTKLQDLAYKVRYFSKLHDVVERLTRGDKLKGAEDLSTELSKGMGNMLQDRFVGALTTFAAELREPLADFVKCYTNFKKWADTERSARRFVAQREEVASVLSKVSSANADRATYATHNYAVGTTDKSSSSSSSSSSSAMYAPSYGSPSRHTQTYGELAISKMSEVDRKLDNLLKDPKLPRHTQLNAQFLELRRKLASLKGLPRDSTESVEIYMGDLPDIERELQTVLQEYDNGAVEDRFDVNKASVDDFFSYQETSPIWLPANAKMERIDPFKTLATLGHLYDIMGQPLLGAIEEGVKVLTTLVRSASHDDPRKRDLQGMLDLLTDLSAQLLLAPLSGKKAKQMDEFSVMIDSKASILRSGDKIAIKRPGAASSGSAGSYGASSSSSPPTESSAAGFMYRRLDKQRLNAYLLQLESFKKAMEGERLVDHLSNLTERLSNRTTELEAQLVAAAKDADPTRADYLKRTLSEAKKLALLGFCRSARRTIGGYVARHINFLLRKHRDAVDYINYWHAMVEAGIVTDEDVIKDIKSYQDLRKEMVVTVKAKLLEDAAAKVRSALEMSVHAKAVGSHIGMSEVQASEVDEAFTKLLVWIGDQGDRVGMMYARGRGSLRDSLDAQFMLIYGLKLLRLLIAWFALRVAGKVFQNMYDDRVYSRDDRPPEPIMFVAMFMGVDLALNVVVAAVLIFVKHLFKTVDNEFPIDRHMLTLWGFDYLLSSLVVFAVAVIIGQVIKRKKYFRYKYEGDRGIRAMQQMVMYVYNVLLFVPFFRLANG
jgi:hypothetical protein